MVCMMVALTEAFTVQHGLHHNLYEEALQEEKEDGPLSSFSGPQHYRHTMLIVLTSEALQDDLGSFKSFTIYLQKNPPSFAQGMAASSPPTLRCPTAATWEPAAIQDAMAAFSRATKITSRLSAYFRTVLSYRATQPNYSRLLLYLLMDVASVCLAYCTFPCKGLPHSLLCTELSSGRLPHTCQWEGPHNTHFENLLLRLSLELHSRVWWLWMKERAHKTGLRCCIVTYELCCAWLHFS